MLESCISGHLLYTAMLYYCMESSKYSKCASCPFATLVLQLSYRTECP